MVEKQEYQMLENPELLISRVDKLRKQGYRLGQACVVTKKEGTLDVVYSFAKDDRLLNIRVLVPEATEVESITSIYPYAFLYENEMRELFGLRVCNINVDFQGDLYLTKVKAPFAIPRKETPKAAPKAAAKEPVKEEQEEQPKEESKEEPKE